MKAKQGSKTIVHEVNDSQHRIVVLNADGTSETGDWAEHRAIAHLNGLFAVVGESPLPQGVFTCKGVQHQVLN